MHSKLTLQVIYHLNNKNEDNEFDMQELADQYEKEIDQVLKDAAAKVNDCNEQLQQQRQRDNEHLEATVQVMVVACESCCIV